MLECDATGLEGGPVRSDVGVLLQLAVWPHRCYSTICCRASYNLSASWDLTVEQKLPAGSTQVPGQDMGGLETNCGVGSDPWEMFLPGLGMAVSAGGFLHYSSCISQWWHKVLLVTTDLLISSFGSSWGGRRIGLGQSSAPASCSAGVLARCQLELPPHHGSLLCSAPPAHQHRASGSHNQAKPTNGHNKGTDVTEPGIQKQKQIHLWRDKNIHRHTETDCCAAWRNC